MLFRRGLSTKHVRQTSPQKVLDFWFGKPSDPTYLEPRPFWYGGPKEDAMVQDALGTDYELARDGHLKAWESEWDSALALILLLDQVPRNIFRDTAKAYATDAYALQVARKVVDNNWDKGKHLSLRRYMYAPFNHSEDIKDQEVSVRLFRELDDPKHTYWAQHHYDIIRQHGRFPHRDKILGR